ESSFSHLREIGLGARVHDGDTVKLISAKVDVKVNGSAGEGGHKGVILDETISFVIENNVARDRLPSGGELQIVIVDGNDEIAVVGKVAVVSGSTQNGAGVQGVTLSVELLLASQTSGAILNPGVPIWINSNGAPATAIPPAAVNVVLPPSATPAAVATSNSLPAILSESIDDEMDLPIPMNGTGDPELSNMLDGHVGDGAKLSETAGASRAVAGSEEAEADMAGATDNGANLMMPDVRAADLVTRFQPIDPAALTIVMQQYLEQVGNLGENLAGLLANLGPPAGVQARAHDRP